MLADALDHLVRGIVDHPDDVDVRTRERSAAATRASPAAARPSRSGSTPTTSAG